MPQKIKEHRVLSWLFAGAFALVAGGFAWTLVSLYPIALKTPLILHFNDMSGITETGGLGQIIIMGIFGLLVTGMNFAIALEFESRRPFFGKFLGGVTLAFAILLFLAFAAIIKANT